MADPIPTVRGGYQEVDVLRAADGVIGIISSRSAAGKKTVYTFALMREFERDGEKVKTQFFSAQYLDSVKAMAENIGKRIEQLVAADVERERLERPITRGQVTR